MVKRLGKNIKKSKKRPRSGTGRFSKQPSGYGEVAREYGTAKQAAPCIGRGWCPSEWGEGGYRRSRRKPDQTNGGREGNWRSRRETMVKESDKAPTWPTRKWNMSMLAVPITAAAGWNVICFRFRPP